MNTMARSWTIYSISKTKEPYIKEGEAEYLKRLRGELGLRLEELAVKVPSNVEPQRVMELEAESLLKRLQANTFLVVLDERGKLFDSKVLANELKTIRDQQPEVAFAIGGAYGWHDTVRKRANLLLSLSKLTFPYQLSRLILIEQLYRATTLWRGAPYHK